MVNQPSKFPVSSTSRGNQETFTPTEETAEETGRKPTPVKALAAAVLSRNHAGNLKETGPETGGNFRGENRVSKFPTFPFLREETRKPAAAIIRQVSKEHNVNPDDVTALLCPEFDIPGIESGEIDRATLGAFIRSLLARRLLVQVPPAIGPSGYTLNAPFVNPGVQQ